jgi:hypothetical protein
MVIGKEASQAAEDEGIGEREEEGRAAEDHSNLERNKLMLV